MNSKTRFLSYVKGQNKRIFAIVLLVFVFVVCQLSQPFLLGSALDAAIALDGTQFLIYIIIATFLAIIGVVTGYLFEYQIGVLTQNVIKKLRDDIYEKINNVSIEVLYKQTKGNIVQIMVGDIENIANGMHAVFKSLIEGVLTIVITIVLMLFVNWILALGVIVLSPLSVLMSRFVAKFSHKYFKRQAELQSNLNSISLEVIENSELIQTYNYQDSEKLSFSKQGEELRKHGTIALFSASWINPSTRLVNNSIYAVIGVIGILMIIYTQEGNATLLSIGGAMSIGKLAAFLSYTNQYTKPFNEISGVLSEYENALSSFDRLNKFLCFDDDIDNGTIDLSSINKIEFKNMDFSYNPNIELIKDFNLKINKGQSVAIVGPTGAGKSTLINVLLNFYSPLGGDILYNGISQHNIRKSSLRNNFGIVLQENWLFRGTVLDNVRYVKDCASDEEVIEACKKAHADIFISTLPHGYQTNISNDGSLSEGEKQMLNIARVFLLSTDIVVLDEATSNIDFRSEMLITDSFDKMMKNNTSIVIAHRLSTIKNADIILVLKDGHIIEQGNHSELIKLQGFYYSMYSSQFKE